MASFSVDFSFTFYNLDPTNVENKVPKPTRVLARKR
jgi:hypothetical protein